MSSEKKIESREAIQEARDAIAWQIKTVGTDIRQLKITVGAVASEDKSFDHFIAYTDKILKMSENLLALDKLLNGETDEETAVTTASKNPLMQKFGPK